MIFSTKQLPLPSVHKGGFLYSDEIIGVLNGVELSQTAIFTKPGHSVYKQEESLAALRSARIGSVYEVEFTNRDGTIENVTFKKIKDDSWKAY